MVELVCVIAFMHFWEFMYIHSVRACRLVEWGDSVKELNSFLHKLHLSCGRSQYL